MSLALPAWLLLLIPWVAVLFYLLLGKPPSEKVPFLWLWRGPAAVRRTKPSLSNLPIWIALLMLAAAAAIVAAAGPSITRSDPAAASRANVRLTAVAVRGSQVMVRLINDTPRRETQITVSTGADTRTETVQLPETGERNYFLDLPPGADSVRVTVDDQSAQLTRSRTWPKIEPRMPLPDAVERVVASYTRNRVAGDDSLAVGIAAGEAALGEGAGVIIAESTSSYAGKVSVTDHAVTRNVDWPSVLTDTRIAAAPPVGYTPVVRVGDRVAVAVLESPRRVWIGFDTPAAAARVGWVVLWTNIFDFTGEGSDEWRAAPGSVFSNPPSAVQKRVQSLSPWLATGAVGLFLVGLVIAWRGGRAG